MAKNFSLSTGIYRVDQHKKISLIVLLFMTPVIIGAVYVVWNSLSQSGETGIGQSISGFFFYLHQEQFMFLILFVALVLSIPLYFFSVHFRTSASITIIRDSNTTFLFSPEMYLTNCPLPEIQSYGVIFQIYRYIKVKNHKPRALKAYLQAD